MKRILLVFLILVIGLTLFSCGEKENVDNETVYPETDDFECVFSPDFNTIDIVGYMGNETELTIPEKFGDYSVISIGNGAFAENYDLEKIDIPDSVTYIGDASFEYCISLREVKLPKNLTYIGKTAFKECRSLESITIPSSVSTVGVGAFYGCDSLGKITVEEGNKYFVSDKYGVLLNIEQTRILQYPVGSTRTKYEMPNSVKTVDGYAFQEAKKLENVSFSTSLETIGSYAFQGASIKKADLSNTKLKEIGDFCFNQTKLMEVSFCNSLEKIGNSAFGWCDAITEVNIPANVKTIGNMAFYMCSSVTKYVVDEQNYMYLSDENGILYSKDKTVLIQYPAASERTEFKIPEGVKNISSNAFVSSMNLKKVIFCKSIYKIESYAFYWCSNLEIISFESGKAPIIGVDAFKDTKIQ